MKNHIHYPQTTSTNTLIKDLLCDNPSLPNMLVVSAGYQTSGRGQRENIWESEQNKNLLFSILFRPEKLSAKDAFAISRIVSVAIAGWLSKYVGNIAIKWPNDIYSGDKKICGILIENSIMGTNLSCSIVGVGININQTEFSEKLPNPTSIAKETGKSYNIDNMLSEVLVKMEEQYNHYFNGGEEDINTKYHNLLYRLNIKAKYKIQSSKQLSENEIVDATIIGVRPNGCLILKHTDCKINTYAFKEVQFVL
ncbi:MAG: biotin--[acetyl-CoA-carboxylase] ligase [Bacteroidales bacterium]|nr:biotin--[acetyl-CoA-carboxylase] ligase [Bacteroidales bacterium]